MKRLFLIALILTGSAFGKETVKSFQLQIKGFDNGVELEPDSFITDSNLYYATEPSLFCQAGGIFAVAEGTFYGKSKRKKIVFTDTGSTTIKRSFKSGISQCEYILWPTSTYINVLSPFGENHRIDMSFLTRLSHKFVAGQLTAVPGDFRGATVKVECRSEEWSCESQIDYSNLNPNKISTIEVSFKN